MTTRSGITALIVAAGTGSRAGGDMPKQYRRIAGKAVLAHAIDAIAAHPAIEVIQVVIGAGQDALYAEAIDKRPLPAPAIGGASRRDSVLAGLAAVETEHVLIHDAARPFVPPWVIDRLIEALERYDGAIPGLPVVDTLALAPGSTGSQESGQEAGSRPKHDGIRLLGEGIDRSALVRIQTPQAFRTTAIRDAHARWPAGREATDDAQVLRAAGGMVAMVEGDESLAKLTYEADFRAAEQRLCAAMISRTGMGFDVHAFGGPGPVWLGGITIEHERGLAGHSDADVALHAITDALLGAAALGDIGDHFPPSDPQWKGAPSRLFLEHAAKLVRDGGGIIDHIDLTIICEEPRIGPYRDSMRASIADMLRVDRSRISVKATTTERLGFTGRREGIAAQAVATIRMKDQ